VTRLPWAGAERVYPELAQHSAPVCKERSHANTVQGDGLVNEVYLRLVDVTKVEWRERAQFFAMAAPDDARILVDAARRPWFDKRGGMQPK